MPLSFCGVDFFSPAVTFLISSVLAADGAAAGASATVEGVAGVVAVAAVVAVAVSGVAGAVTAVGAFFLLFFLLFLESAAAADFPLPEGKSTPRIF